MYDRTEVRRDNKLEIKLNILNALLLEVVNCHGLGLFEN